MTLTIEQTQKLFDMLQGGKLDGMTLAEQPKLSAEAAFSVIYYLQEKLRIIPDHYEMCPICNELYDNWAQGITVDAGSEDSWYENNDIPASVLEKYDGSSVCSSECEYALLMTQETT